VEYESEGTGFYFEADAVARDLLEERKESAIVPLRETVRIMRVMDDIRMQCGVEYPQDKEGRIFPFIHAGYVVPQVLSNEVSMFETATWLW